MFPLLRPLLLPHVFFCFFFLLSLSLVVLFVLLGFLFFRVFLGVYSERRIWMRKEEEKQKKKRGGKE